MNRLVSYREWLLHQCHPTSRFDPTEGIKVVAIIEMTTLALVNLGEQLGALRRSGTGIWFEVICEERCPLLVEDLENEAIGKLDSGQSLANSFYKDRVANESKDRPIGRVNRGDNVCDEAAIGEPWMDRGDDRLIRRSR